MRPYKVMDESETHITFEYRTAYTWTLYAILLIVFVGMVAPYEPLTLVGAIAVVAYFAAKLSFGSEVNARIRKAMQSNTVQISGNKASFGNPLRVRVPK